MPVDKTNLARTRHKKTLFLVPGQAQSNVASKKIKDFQKAVRNYYRKHGRHSLPWRKTKNPYRILVSEVMLQQTQVDRVIPYYKKFLKQFPTIKSLAEAPLGDVLRLWQGLGYNRRAKMLHEAATTTMIYHSGRIPREYDDLIKLPGVGDYTAKAVRVFAHNEREIMIETNIRTVFLHHFFPNSENITDQAIVPYMELLLDGKKPREWYAALMDYGAHLKRTSPNPSRKSAHHTKQKPFRGSNREIRGTLLRTIGEKPQTLSALQTLPFEKERIKEQLSILEKEGMIIKKGQRYQLP